MNKLLTVEEVAETIPRRMTPRRQSDAAYNVKKPKMRTTDEALSLRFEMNDRHWRRHHKYIAVAAEEPRKPWVYFMRTSDYIKVGHSRNIIKRLAEIRLANPMPILLIGLLPGEQKLETKILRAMREHGGHVSGEWFRATTEMVWLVENLCDG